MARDTLVHTLRHLFVMTMFASRHRAVCLEWDICHSAHYCCWKEGGAGERLSYEAMKLLMTSSLQDQAKCC